MDIMMMARCAMCECVCGIWCARQVSYIVVAAPEVSVWMRATAKYQLNGSGWRAGLKRLQASAWYGAAYYVDGLLELCLIVNGWI